jgi:hypothetical protein
MQNDGNELAEKYGGRQLFLMPSYGRFLTNSLQTLEIQELS